MAFENSQAFIVESRKKEGIKQFESTCRIEVQAEKPVKRVLSINALPKIMSSEKVMDSVSFLGRTSYQIVYQTEDNKLVSVQTNIDWQDKIDFGAENFVLQCKIIDNVVSDFSSMEISITSLIEVDLNSVNEEKISPVTGLTDDYVLLEKNYDFQRKVNEVKENFIEVIEEQVPYKIQEVLNYNSNVYLKNVSAGIDSITLEGDISLDINVLTKDGVIKITKQNSFRQEFSALSVVPNNLVDASVNLTDIKVVVSANETDDKTDLIATLELQARAIIYIIDQINVIEDAFSIKKETVSTGECVCVENFLSDGYYQDTLNGIFDCERDYDKLLFISSQKAIVKNTSDNEEGITLLGDLVIDAVCEVEGENVKISGVVPFSLNVPELKKEDKYDLITRIISSRLSNQKTIEVSIEIFVRYKKYSKEFVTFISSIDELEDKEVSDSAIRVIVTREGEDLFSIAKANSIKPEELCKQNPGVEDGVNAGMRLIVYTPLDTNF